MSDEVRNLKPKEMWSCFADFNAVPRPSKKEEKVIQFVKEFGENLNLETKVDEVGNVIIKKPATSGMENRKTVVLQSHIDMVHQKNAGTVFDFNKQGIEMYVDDDWVKAKGTTLGADNGIGVASIMAILASETLEHPAIEGLFTIDEETGMTGAMGLKGGVLDAEIMLNLDTEDDDELTIGCAGGLDVNADGKYKEEVLKGNRAGFELSIKGLSGGHSGMDIHKGRGNANKLMNRFLYHAEEKFDLRISMINGGGLRNAIPRESMAVFSVSSEQKGSFQKFAAEQENIIKAEHSTTDPDLKFILENSQAADKVLNKYFQNKLLRAVYGVPNGIHRMSPDLDGVVQTSNNLARVWVVDGEYSLQCLSRSAVESEKMDLADCLKAIFELLGSTVTFFGDYPSWTPKPDSNIIKVMETLYANQFGTKAKVSVCHAGLECGILGKNYPNMEMISFGPNIRGAHSPDEKVQISSVQKYWPLLLETLKHIPERG